MPADTIILFSTQDEVMRYRKRMASISTDASLGIEVTTPHDLIARMWEVWGSTETLISDAQRSMIVSGLLATQDAWVVSAGTVDLLASFLRDHACFFTDEFIAAHDKEFTKSDRAIVTFVSRYRDALGDAGLIEPARALCKLARSVEIGTIIIRTQTALPGYWRDFIDRAVKQAFELDAQIAPANAELVLVRDPALFVVEERPAESQDERALYVLSPSGRTAEAYAVWETITQHVRPKKALVAAPDPRALFTQMKDALIRAGYSVIAQMNVPFVHTFFGRAYDAAFILFAEVNEPYREELIEAARTLLFSPYAGVPPTHAQRLVNAILADRTFSRAQIASTLSNASRSLGLFEELFEDAEADILLAYFEELIGRLDITDSEQDQEREAISSLKVLYRDARSLGQEACALHDLVQQIVIPANEAACSSLEEVALLEPFADERNEKPQVLFTTLSAAAKLPRACCDLVVVTSLDSATYNGAESRTTLTDFLERYQLPLPETKLVKIDEQFKRTCALAVSAVALSCAQQDIDGNESFPAFFFDAFLNEARLKGRKIVELAYGEEQFDRTRRLVSLGEDEIVVEPLARKGFLDQADRASLLEFAVDAEGVLRPVISPSSLETYLSCPYKWFVTRKLHLEEVGETFGPREVGTFVHRLFQTFYEQWMQAGHARVDARTLNEALEQLERIFDELVDEQEEREKDDRLVATSEMEREEIARLKRQVLDNLRFQQDLFSTYRVSAHEVEIAAEERLVYAGAIMRGRIDRLDVDEAGNFVVIDYKGSIGQNAAGFDPAALVSESEEDEEAFTGFSDEEREEALARGMMLPSKIQTLMYAQALKRRDPALHPRAAVYLSYKAKQPNEVLAGSLPETFFHEAKFTKSASIVKGDFEHFLDLIERALTPVVDAMVAGDIEPRPHDEGACTYCPVLYCEKRVDGSR